MQSQLDIEIYVRDCAIEKLLAWARSRLGRLDPPESVDGAVTVYPSLTGRLVVTSGIEDDFISLWFNTPTSPWDTDVDCARDAARELGCTVRCDPGSHFPEAGRQSSIFLEIVGGRERPILWES